MENELRNMVMAFRVTELQNLLGYAGVGRSGRKNELQARALELVTTTPPDIVARIRELYKTVQLALDQQGPPTPTSSTGSGLYLPTSPSINITPKLYSVYSDFLDNVDEKVLSSVSSYPSFNSSPKHIQNNLAAFVSLPICPDVRIKKLPFYEIQAELMKPTSLISTTSMRTQEEMFSFCLTPQQVSQISSSKEVIGDLVYSCEPNIDYQIQVQLRFCLLDPNGEQVDNFPPSICVKVNGKVVTLPNPIPSNRPGVEPKRPAKPINVTNYVKLSSTCSNTVGVTWASDSHGRGWVMHLHLVKKLTSFDLLQRLKSKGVRPADYTKGMIKEIVMKDDGDCQIAMTSFVVSMACPLGKCRMSLPCRASTCSHLQCFDANLFLQMNEKKPMWTCPVCDKPCLFDNLSIDGYFQEIINSLSFDAGNDVKVYPDGLWKAVPLKTENNHSELPLKRIKVEVQVNEPICLDDDLIIEELPNSPNPNVTSNRNGGQKSNQKKVIEVVDLTLSDSDDDDKDDEPPVTVRPKRRPPVIVDESSSSSSASSSSSSSSCSTCSVKSNSSSTKLQIESSVLNTSAPPIPYPTFNPTTLLSSTHESSISPKPSEWNPFAVNYKNDYHNHFTHFSASINTNMNSTSNYNGFGHGLTCPSYSASTVSNEYFPSQLVSVSSSTNPVPSIRSSSPSNPNSIHISNLPVSTTNPEPIPYEQRFWDNGFPNLDLGTLDFGSLFSDLEQQSGSGSGSSSNYLPGLSLNPSSPSSSHDANNANKIQSVTDSDNYYNIYWPYSCNEFTN